MFVPELDPFHLISPSPSRVTFRQQCELDIFLPALQMRKLRHRIGGSELGFRHSPGPGPLHSRDTSTPDQAPSPLTIHRIGFIPPRVMLPQPSKAHHSTRKWGTRGHCRLISPYPRFGDFRQCQGFYQPPLQGGQFQARLLRVSL